MISNKPLVSVIMATYNEKPNIIKSSIQSILDQSYSNFELLIFDDSTNVETKSAIDDMSKDSRVCVYRESTRVGFVESLNKGLKKAQGDFIARMDGDDFALRERLEKEVSFLLTHKNIMVVGGQMDIMDEHDNIVSHRNYPEMGEILHENWMLKKTLASGISNPAIDDAYSIAMEKGAKGGKLLGAGGGGFLLFYVPKDKQKEVKEAIGLPQMPIEFDRQGAAVIYVGDKPDFI